MSALTQIKNPWKALRLVISEDLRNHREFKQAMREVRAFGLHEFATTAIQTLLLVLREKRSGNRILSYNPRTQEATELQLPFDYRRTALEPAERLDIPTGSPPASRFTRIRLIKPNQ